MCGIAGVFGPGARRESVDAMVRHLRHRGPDAQWVHGGSASNGCLGMDRLAIIDLAPSSSEALVSPTGTRLAYNGEIYNHVELRRELAGYPFRTGTDTEVLLAAYERWGAACLDRLLGMFAVAFWDEETGQVVAARDRFGVKPLYFHVAPDGTLTLASEIGALLAAGVPAVVDEVTWSTYLTSGLTDHSTRTFWTGIARLPPGHLLRWQSGHVTVEPWYDLVAATGPDDDPRPVSAVVEEYRALLLDSVRLRFRSDVPVGVNLSGGLDSATLLALVEQVSGAPSPTYTFATGDDRYDETPWVRQMVAGSPHTATVVTLDAGEVPRLAQEVQAAQDEPFGGLPTLAYARLFERAREDGTVVLLDGQGMDEQWAGYDYYGLAGGTDEGQVAPIVQGIGDRPVRPECLCPDFAGRAEPFVAPTQFGDALRRLQHRDLLFTKLPRALRFNDRVSMRVSTELREPFLDHRLVELALRQPVERKWRDGSGKWLLRLLAADLVPAGLVTAPKRPVQTPQREWLRGPLRGWATARIDLALEVTGDRWLDPKAVRRAWDSFVAGEGDNGFFAWQWVNLGLAIEQRPGAFGSL